MSLPDCKLCREDSGRPGCDLLELRMKSGNLNCTNFRPKVMAKPKPKTFMNLTAKQWLQAAAIAIVLAVATVVFFRTLHILWPEGY